MDASGPGPAVANILVVDDSPTNLKVLSHMLAERGYKARLVPNGELALKAATALPPDLILLDINMRGMDGFEVCRRLKADPSLREVPVIFLSGLIETGEKIKAFAVGGVDYVTKPFQFDEVDARINTHLKLRSLQRKLEAFNRDLQGIVQEQVREISDSQMATIFALSKLAEYRDAETGNHLARVQRYCRTLAVHLARRKVYGDLLNATFIEDLYHASPLHDIGKVGIPDHILLKPQPLTPEELNVMQTHTLLGARALSSILSQYPNNHFLKMGVDLARSHHERWDASGYPDGLAGAAIPLSARIHVIADQYDALRSPRPYKPAFDAARTYRILTEGDGRTLPAHFDPEVLEAFKQAAPEFEAIGEALRDDKANAAPRPRTGREREGEGSVRR